MNDAMIRQTVAEVMDRFDESLRSWLLRNGTDQGFYEWFTEQVFEADVQEHLGVSGGRA